MRSRRFKLGLLLTAAAMAACSGDVSPPPQAAGESGGNTKAAAEPPPVCIDGTGAQGGKIDRPAVALKIENSREARPQSGLENADVVYEEVVEGGITRFMALYHCGQSAKAGPVRSARFDDAKIALPFTRVLAYSGSNAFVEKELTKRSMVTLTELNAGDAFFRVPTGSTDIHSLYANTEKIRSQAPKKADAPGDGVFEFGELHEGASDARKVTINFNSSNTIEYRWGQGAWWRFEAGEKFLSASGGQISVPNLLVQQVDVDSSKKIVDPVGNPSPDIDLAGKGKALLFRDGHVTKGVWKVKKEGDAPTFETRSGKSFTFAEGPIWVELVPSGKGQVKGSFSYR
ncbi:MAG: DUF3048 domain-containing protein [Actinobacteria bacterium]|nr:DUF3048 domain-containing protein [Actinomycetota bacterium]